MESKEQKGYVFNPFLNPIEFWRDYLMYWIEASRGFYENAIKANENWLAALWIPWLRAASIERKETAKVE